jgi:hypothetical protein
MGSDVPDRTVIGGQSQSLAGTTNWPRPAVRQVGEPGERSLQAGTQSGVTRRRLDSAAMLSFGGGTGTSLLHPGAAAATSAGTPGWITALIAALAAVLAATATALASAYAARRKVAEIELTNSFQLANQYLESARRYTETVYLPLAVAVHDLHSAFLAFKAVIREPEVPAATTNFTDKISTFLAATNKQFAAGASAVLTFKLDDTLTGFTAFIDKSRSVAEPVTVNEVAMIFSLGFYGLQIHRSLTRQFSSSILPYDEFTFRILGMGMGLRQNPMLVAAPLGSDEFAKRFTFDINQIKAAIKEVTLGAYNAP